MKIGHVTNTLLTYIGWTCKPVVREAIIDGALNDPKIYKYARNHQKFKISVWPIPLTFTLLWKGQQSNF
jgi:hypothetical protein